MQQLLLPNQRLDSNAIPASVHLQRVALSFNLVVEKNDTIFRSPIVYGSCDDRNIIGLTMRRELHMT